MAKTASKYDQDLRFAPADESMSDDELRARSDRLTRTTLSGGAPRHDGSKPKAEIA